MARNATRIGQIVVAVHVALRALHSGMRTGEREPRRIVVKRCPGP